MAGKNHGNEVFAIHHDDYGTTYSSKTYRAKNENKQSGSYERVTAKDKKVTREPFVDRSGREGYKDEHFTSRSYKTGDKNGYTEYSYEEKVKYVNYDQSTNSSNNNAKRSYSKCDEYFNYDKSTATNNNYKRVKWYYPECNKLFVASGFPALTV